MVGTARAAPEATKLRPGNPGAASGAGRSKPDALAAPGESVGRSGPRPALQCQVVISCFFGKHFSSWVGPPLGAAFGVSIFGHAAPLGVKTRSVILGCPSGGRGHAPYGARRGRPRPYNAAWHVGLRPTGRAVGPWPKIFRPSVDAPKCGGNSQSRRLGDEGGSISSLSNVTWDRTLERQMRRSGGRGSHAVGTCHRVAQSILRLEGPPATVARRGAERRVRACPCAGHGNSAVGKDTNPDGSSRRG
jgi:hypothetical protein